MRWLSVLILLGACGGASVRSPQERLDDSAPAVTALRAAKFADAERAAASALGQDPHNARAAAVRAIATYQQAGERLIADLGKVLEEAGPLKALDHETGRAVWRAFLGRLEAIDRDLVVAAEDPSFALELCLACWEYDWNRSGAIDDRDRKMFELEYNGELVYDGTRDLTDNGRRLEEEDEEALAAARLSANDPRRRPTYRFDAGDVAWARAMIAFQRAAVEIVLAYRWSELDKLLWGGRRDDKRMTIKLADAGCVARAHQLIVDGLAHSDRSRAAYLAETDDDREWLPNPRQKSYAMPLAVTPELYATWEAVVGDLRRMLASEEGISLRALAELAEGRPTAAPDAYIDVGRMLRQPADIVLDLSDVQAVRSKSERIMRGLLGNGYRDKMRPSPLMDRLRRMNGELERSHDTFERKLRYFLWIN